MDEKIIAPQKQNITQSKKMPSVGTGNEAEQDNTINESEDNDNE